MIRRQAIAHNIGGSTGFRWRSHEISRIEGLSDAVFAFAITLLVVALEVPETFSELVEKMHGFLGFLVSFFLLFQVWFYQYTFFRRYGLQDHFVIWMNAFLMFVVLFYVYPLKFLFTLISNLVTGGRGFIHHRDGTVRPMLNGSDAPALMIVFSLGFAAVFIVFLLLYWHAYRKRAQLELTDLELLETRDSMRECLLFALAGVSSALLASLGTGWVFWAQVPYLLIAPAQIVNGLMAARARRRLQNTAQ